MAAKRQLIIDADFMLYQLCEAMKRDCGFPALNPETLEPYDENEQVSVHWADSADVADAMDRKILERMAETRCSEAVLVFSGTKNFRKELWSGYKLSRAATIKPPAYWTTFRRLKSAGKYQVLLEDCLEGDDYVGILLTRPSPVHRIADMTDKDVMTLPDIEVYREGEIQKTTQASADRFHLIQTLMGDTTDGYKGCPGMGKVSAAKVLDAPGDPWTNVLKAYEAAFKKTPERFVTDSPLEEALLNARMARILRFEDWDPKARRPILWHPEPSERRTYAAPKESSDVPAAA